MLIKIKRSRIVYYLNPGYLTVASLDPVTIILSSYCKHSTEPVWPCNTCVQSNDFLFQS